jgi:hypothetical protein
VAPEDGGPTEAEAMNLPHTPDESLVVDIMIVLQIEQAHRILMQAPHGVG